MPLTPKHKRPYEQPYEQPMIDPDFDTLTCPYCGSNSCWGECIKDYTLDNLKDLDD